MQPNLAEPPGHPPSNQAGEHLTQSRTFDPGTCIPHTVGQDQNFSDSWWRDGTFAIHNVGKLWKTGWKVALAKRYDSRRTMKRHASRLQTRTHADPHDHSANHCRAIVLVDGAGIREKIKKDYEKVLREIDNSRRQLDQFHQTDLPQFTRWLNTLFGVLLTEIRELSQKMAVAEILVFQVQNEVMFEGGSYARAYKRVMELRENPEPPPLRPAGSGEPDRERNPFGSRPESGSFDGKDPLEEFFNEVFGEFGPGESPRGKRAPLFGHHPEASPCACSRLKELYRSLVRRLHPDTQQEMTTQKSEWWHQVQAAYEAGDVEQLEVILTLCEIGDSGTTAHTSASLLQRTTATLKSSLREIKRQIAGRRKDPAWNFSRRSDRDVMAVQMHRRLMADLEDMREQWRQTQEMIAGWKTGAERLKQPRRRNRRAQGWEFSF
jgi:hypothetical protein